ncbi:tyrosyl-tRNA synthetase [Malassezia pachydermatis]
MEQLNKNVMAIRTQLYQFFHNAAAYLSRRGLIHATPVMFSPEVSEVGEPLFQDSLNIQILNNYNWFKNVSMLEFLSGVGRYARVNDMLARDSVKSRLFPTNGSIAGISFTEFSYQLMQAHDFSVLHKDKQCSVQLGGSDQMGNIMAGIDLIRRQRAAQADSTANPNMREEPAYGLTLPLLTTASGAKFGKSAGNAVWISSSLLSDFDFYQYFMRSADVDVERYLLSLTLLPIEKIEQIMAEHAQDRSKRIAQRWLASEMTELVRGEKALQKATLATNVLFNTDLQSLTLDQVEFAFENDPRLVYLKEPVEDVIQLATETKLVASRSMYLHYFYTNKFTGETRRFIQQKSGLYLNNKSVTDVHAKVSQDELLQGRFIVMRAGRSNHKIIVFPH